MPGVIVSYGVGALLILTGLFRQYLTLSMMRNNPEVKENEEITYYFGNAGIRAVRDGQEENMGFYKAVYRIWEDEKTFYVGMNEDDLLILPKDRFEEGSAEDFPGVPGGLRAERITGGNAAGACEPVEGFSDTDEEPDHLPADGSA